MTSGGRALAEDEAGGLSAARLILLRGGYLFLGLGLAITRWPLVADAAGMPAYEGVVTAMLVAMSGLALLGVRYPVRMLPVLLFETAWKLVWLGAVALPHLRAGDLDATTERLLVNVVLVVVVIAAIPWDLVWRRYVRAPGDRWR